MEGAAASQRVMGGAAVGQAPAIVVERLRKDYGKVRAVDGVSFQVQRGEIYALLGPNGAGKTSTVEILEGHRRRSGGTVQVLGFDPGAGDRHFGERIGIVLQSGGIDAELTVREMVSLYVGFYARPRDVTETIERVGPSQGRRRGRYTPMRAGGRVPPATGAPLISRSVAPAARSTCWETR